MGGSGYGWLRGASRAAFGSPATPSSRSASQYHGGARELREQRHVRGDRDQRIAIGGRDLPVESGASSQALRKTDEIVHRNRPLRPKARRGHEQGREQQKGAAGESRHQKIASGLTGDPVPPSTGSGANVIANS